MNKAEMKLYELGREDVITASTSNNIIQSLGSWNAMYFYDSSDTYTIDSKTYPKAYITFFNSEATALGNGTYIDDGTHTGIAQGDNINNRGLYTLAQSDITLNEVGLQTYFVNKGTSTIGLYELLTTYADNKVDLSEYNGNYDFTSNQADKTFTFIYVGEVDDDGKVKQ